nr:hypothetical protein BaRGS_034571 [Batillaria attramentaria]
MLNEFDVERTTSRSSLFINGRAVRKREILVGVLVVFLVVIVVLAALLASASTSSNGTPCVGGTDLQKGFSTSQTGTNVSLTGTNASQTGSNTPENNVCLDYSCLGAAAHVLSLLNKSVSPCDDFYNYACGKFPQMNPLDANTPELTTASIIFHKTKERIRKLLDKPPISNANDSYDRKAKVFYSSCQDHFYRTTLGGKPFLDHVISELPGSWWALDGDDDWDDAAWDLNSVLKMTQVDFWTAVFFRFYIKRDEDWNEPAIQIEKWGTTLPHYLFLNQQAPEFAKTVTDYKTYIRTVGSLLLRDADLNITDAERENRAERFVSDAFELEVTIAQITDGFNRQPYPFSSEARMTLQELNIETSGVVDFVSLGKYTLSEAGVGGNTPVLVPEKAFLVNLTDWIKDEMAADPKTIKRKLSNYIVWRLAHRYSQDLSWEYTTAGQQFEMDMMGHSIEVRDSVMKIGYPDYMMSEDTLNMMYSTFTVNEDTHFQNVLSSNKLRQEWLNRQFNNDAFDWGISMQSKQAVYNNPLKELIVPAGMLQFPIYDHTSPNYMNFGSMGAMVGTALVSAVDEEGSMFHLNGSQRSATWWSNNTWNDYQQVSQCMVDAYSDAVQGPFGKGSLFTPVNVSMLFYTTQAFRDSSGVKLAYEAYKNWMEKTGGEKRMPGAAWTNEQSFFVAFAQVL